MTYCPVDGTGGDDAYVDEALERESSRTRRREAEMKEAFVRMEAERLAEAERTREPVDPRQLPLFGAP